MLCDKQSFIFPKNYVEVDLEEPGLYMGEKDLCNPIATRRYYWKSLRTIACSPERNSLRRWSCNLLQLLLFWESVFQKENIMDGN